MQVLLVDDQPLMHELMPPVLRRAFGDDVEVVSVSDLEAAFQRLAHHKAPQLALLDLGLPGHAGVDTLRRFRWKFPGVPVIVVSGTEDAATVRVARGMGVAGYLPKTLKPDDMVTALRQVAGGGSWFPEAGSHGR